MFFVIFIFFQLFYNCIFFIFAPKMIHLKGFHQGTVYLQKNQQRA